MTKIKRAPKRSPSTNPGIAAFILAIQSCTPDSLPSLLNPISSSGWTWPRTDLQHWIQPLNRFDSILEDVIRDYDLGSMEHCQTNAFTPRTKELVGAILAFEKVLLENSTNRKIFASFDRLNDLLHTTDLSILLATLRLALRPAQQYSSTNGSSSSSTFGIAEKRLLSLAQGWGTREFGLEMVDLAGDVIEIPSELDEAEWQFYKKATTVTTGLNATTTTTSPQTEKKEKGKEMATTGGDAMEVEQDDTSTSVPKPTESSTSAPSHGTPAPKPRATFAAGALLATPIPSTPLANSSSTTSAPTEGLTTVHLGNVRASSSSAVDILVDSIEAHSIPEPDRLELLQKIRIAKSLSTTSDRRTMLVIRLLSIAIFAHTSTEASAQSKLFLFEPELIPQLAELVHPDRNVPIEIQAAAFYALDALAKYKTKLGEVASALNAGVSHGILMYVFRRTVSDLEGDNPVSTLEFIDSLFNLLLYFQTHSFVGNQIVGAGIVSMLVDLSKNQRRDRVAVVTKSIIFLDSLMYGYNSAFTLFISAGGLGVFVERVKDEIAVCIDAHSATASTSQAVVDAPTGLLSYEQAALLKALLRAIQRLMQTAGTTEGLRNLIDSTLLGSVKSIMEHRAVFGPQIFALAINITATFVHNEPTCLTTIQEAAVPAALYDSIEDSIPASIDVLQAIPNAVGALCLNPAGLTEFNARPLIVKYFAIFASEKHVKVLLERDNGNLLGASIDELVRHHPSLKDRVLDAIVGVLKEVKESAEKWTPEQPEGYVLQLAEAKSEEKKEGEVVPSTDVEMQDAPSGVNASTTGTTPKPLTEEYKDNHHMQCIDVLGRFLEGLFQNLQHCKDFVKLDPVGVLLDLVASPCMPLIAPSTAGFSSISSVLRIMSEVKPVEMVQAILVRVKKSLEDNRWFWEGEGKESRLVPMLTPSSDDLASQSARFRSLTILLSYIALLSDIYSNLTYARGKVSSSVLAVLANQTEAETLQQIGQVNRVATWENICLKPFKPKSEAEDEAKKNLEKVVASVNATAGGAATASTSASSSSEEKKDGEEKKDVVPTSPNFKWIQDVVTNFPLNIAPVFQAAIKLFVPRSNSDATHRKSAADVAATIAQIMTENLRWPDSSDVSNNLSYSTLMLGITSTLLFDERANMTGLQTLLLGAFEKAGGFDAYLALYSRYQDVATSLIPTSSEEPNTSSTDVSLAVVHVFGGLKKALELLSRLSSHRTILEAPQTALLLTREKDKASPDYFDPHHVLVRLRAAILPAVTATWDVAWLRKSPPNVVRSIVGTLVNILRAEGETSTDPATGSGSHERGPMSMTQLLAGGPGAGGLGALGAALGLGGRLGAGGGPAPPFALDETRVAQLVDMGFPRSAAVTSLTRYRNNVGVATEYLLQHPDVVGAARAREEAEALNPAPAAPAVEAAPAAGDAPALVDGAAPVPAADPDAAAPAAEPRQEGDVEMGDAEPAAAPAPADPAPEAAAPAPEPIVVDSTTAEERIKAREDEAKATKARLDESREVLKPIFLPRALSLAEDYGDLVFDIKGVFSLLNAEGEKAAPSLKPLLDDLTSPFSTDKEVRTKQDAAAMTRLRVIALLASDAAYRETIESSREDLMKTLVKFQQAYLEDLPAVDARPKWLASVMLVADSLFSITEVPKPTTILAAGEEVPSIELVRQGPSWTDERQGFFKVVMDLLAKGVSDRETFLSTLRLLLVLTRDADIAASFVQADGLRLLFSSFAKERPETDGCRSYMTMILRHVIEDKALLLPMMEREIEVWFAQPRAKVADITGFLRGASSIAFRNIETFLEATRSTCKLVQADAPSHYHVALLNEPSLSPKVVEPEPAIRSPLAEGEEPPATIEATMEDSKISDAKPDKQKLALPAASANAEATVHFLMAEALESSKTALTPIPGPTASPAKDDAPLPATDATPSTPQAQLAPLDPAAPPASPKKEGKDSHIPVDIPLGDFYQTSFALSSLAELLASYSACKTSFLSFSTRRPTQAGKEIASGPVKPRSSFLYFLLNDLIPVGSVLSPSDFEAKRRSTVSHFASLAVVALCYDASSSPTPRDPKESSAAAQEIANVRKAVLDAIARAFKDATASNEPTDVRYGRLFALSDLCYRLLTSRPFPGVSKPTDEASMQLAKLMLEKNFAGILTNALADVDLNFPSVNNLINSILRPLEQLTKVVTKVGRSKNSVPAAGNGRYDEDSDSTDGESFDEDDEVDIDTDEEEAPDLYRNSALGMYEGELEHGHQDDSYMSGDSAEDYDEDDEMMDEMEDGVLPGSDVSDVSDDDEDEAAFAEEMEMALDEEGDDLDDDSDSDDSGDDDGHEHSEDEMLEAFVDPEEMDGEEEGSWVDEDDDGEEEVFNLDDQGNIVDLEDDGGDNPLDQGDGLGPLMEDDGLDGDSEDPDSYTDEEEEYLTGELEFDAEMTEQLRAQQANPAGFGWDPVGNGDGNAGRRNRFVNDLMQMGDIFDRPRGAPTAAQSAAHPLLVDAPAGDARPDAPSRRQRGGGATRGTPEYEAWAQNIEQMLGPGGVDTLHDLLGAHGLSHLSGPDQLRVGLAPGPDGSLAMVIDPSPALQQAQAHGGQDQRSRFLRAGPSTSSAPRSNSRQLTDRLNATSQFLPVQTLQRWQEESRITQGSVLVAERIARLVNHVINVLHPPARAFAKEQKEKQDKEAAEEEAKLKEHQTSRIRAHEELERRELAGAADAGMQVETETLSDEEEDHDDDDGDDSMEGVQDDVAEVMNLARSLAAGLAVPSQPTPPPAPIPPRAPTPPVAAVGEDAIVVDHEEAAPVASGSGAGPAPAAAPEAAPPQERVTITVHGREVDITDTGIDPTFLEALPDEMREEVIQQHTRESRSSGPPAAAVPTQINSEFLDALPPDLRAEVLRQEAAEQRREQAAARNAARAAAGDAPAPDAGTPAPRGLDGVEGDLLGALDPAAVLDGADGFLGGLPEGLLGRMPRAGGPIRRLFGARAGDAPAPPVKKPAVHREAIQLLDKSGLATLVRLLFFPQPLRRNSLQKVLVNLCENSRTRVELINLLLTILQDGTRDVSAVDKSFSQMSLRASKSLGAKDTPRRKVLETPGGTLPHFPGESVPNLIAQRCLEALMFLVSSNDQSPLFFLTEQEIVVGLSRRSSKKGKGKEKAVPSMTFPVIVLLGLLDRPALLKTQSMMDSLTQLLSAITKSLAVLQKKSKTPEEEANAPSTSENAAAAAVVAAAPSSTGAPAVADAPAPAPPAVEDPAPDATPTDASKDRTKEAATADILVKTPPQIPAAVLRLVVNILDSGECSSKTFQQTLVLIQNLSYLPEAREVISEELKSRAQTLCDALVPDLDELLAATQGTEQVRGGTLAKFSPASSLQAKLLRILKTIDWVNAPPKKLANDESRDDKKLTPEEEKVKEIFHAFKFAGLWKRLGDCLVNVEARPELLYLATVLLPMIESLMVVSKYVFIRPSKADGASPKSALSPPPEDDAESMESLFLAFTDDHRKILNTMVKNNPSLLSGSFSILVHNPKVLEFENKRSYFFSRLHDRNQRQRNHYGTVQVNVRRQHVFEDSFRVLQSRSGDEIKHGKLNVKFYDEEGVDAGGVTREWFSVLARQMFNPDYALFQPQAADALTYQPNKSSSIHREHLLFFKFVGRIIGKALHDQRILEAYFSRSVYKHMLGKRIDHNDLESIDPEYHKSLVWMLGNDIDGVIDLTFSVERDDFGVVEIVDLIPDGRNIAVTNENKAEYVRLIADHRLSAEIKDQISALLQGLYEIVPKDLLRIFSEKELELLISGLPEIDVDEWRANTDLHNFSPTDPVIGYFWRAVRSFSHEERAKLLQFVSGSSRVPLEGFASLQGMSGVTKFSITSAGNVKGLPTAHTCFNQLDLGTGYESYEALRKALVTAITEGAGGFGFA